MTVPYFQLVERGELVGEPCSTDVLVDQFDFGHNTEDDLDALTKNVPVGGEIDIRCADCYDEPGVDDKFWTITLRRIS